MVEPTESEPLTELDRFIEAMIMIRNEIRDVENGLCTAEESVLRAAPFTAVSVTQEQWNASYSRRQAVFPTAASRRYKYWPPVRRVDNAYGDRNLSCSCMSWPGIGLEE